MRRWRRRCSRRSGRRTRCAAPEQEGGASLLYVDLHLVHEVTSPQAFEGLRLAGRKVRRPDRTLATADHNVPTDPRERTGLDAIADHLSRKQVEALERNCAEFGVPLYGMRSRRQGIVHVIGPELGLSQPGITIACGDSHTSTHGALGALAMPIGTSEVEHVLATQCLLQARPRTMRITYEGEPGFGVTAKDLILGTIGQISAAGAVGHAIEYAGAPIEALSIEGRMTICNMSIEAGARAGMIAPDDVTFAYLEGRPGGARGLRRGGRALALAADRPRARHSTPRSPSTPRRSARRSPGARTPGRSSPVTGRVPDPAELEGPADRESAERALAYMALEPGTAIEDIALDRVFIGSCTNSRIEDLRAAAAVVEGRKVITMPLIMTQTGFLEDPLHNRNQWVRQRRLDDDRVEEVRGERVLRWRRIPAASRP